MIGIGRISRKHRVGIDIDTKNQFELLRRYFNSKRFGDVLVYETLHGYHLHIYRENRSIEDNMQIRMILGDCQNRLDLDEARIRFGLGCITETLFEYKRMDNEISIEEKIDILNLPFWGLSNQ